ncbi:MAG: anthrone oxygenase family protein [Desulfobacterales bacterium]
MLEGLFFALTFAAVLGCGLIAGLFFAFSTFVMKALAHLPPAGGIAAMQSINIAVLNPWFFAAFFGTSAVCFVLLLYSLFNWSEPGAIYLLTGGLLYLLGTILVTVVFNVPLNDALAAVEPGSVAGADLWTRYLSVWTSWNHVRTAGALGAAAAFIMALR